MAIVLGKDCKLYRNTGTSASPVWNEISNVADLTLNLAKDEDDVTTRQGSGWRQRVYTIKDGSTTFTMVWDNDDDDFIAIRDAWSDDTQIDMWVLDGDVTTTGSEGLRASFEVGNITRTEPVAAAARAEVTIAPGFNTDQSPSYDAVP